MSLSSYLGISDDLGIDQSDPMSLATANAIIAKTKDNLESAQAIIVGGGNNDGSEESRLALATSLGTLAGTIAGDGSDPISTDYSSQLRSQYSQSVKILNSAYTSYGVNKFYDTANNAIPSLPNISAFLLLLFGGTIYIIVKYGGK